VSASSDKIANDDCTEATVSSAQPVCEFGTMCFGGCNKCEQDSDCIQDKPSARTCDTDDRNSMTQETEEETTCRQCSSLATKRPDPLARTARSGGLHMKPWR
jgi:hypothetical protein